MDKKTALEAKKKHFLNEIKDCERQIAKARLKCSSEPRDDDGSSSDSDCDTLLVIDTTPSIAQLRQQQEELRNCLNATQELCDTVIIESEVNILPDQPPLINEPPVTEPGTWREVIAECSVDHLVPFVISFYVHQPECRFFRSSFRGLNIKLIKTKHQIELSKSVLPELVRPSDAVEVIRSYAAAFRSRRDSLARLHDKFGSDIVMDAKPEGGFVINCANLIEISWTLQNKFSPIAPFHHRMKFDVEYMDEEYIKSIAQTHRQLYEPDVDTEERTMLLANIIATCLQAREATQELHESLSSDPEGPSYLDKMRTTLDREPDVPGTHRRSKQSTIMAPPKTVPKKTKPKPKESMNANSKTGNVVKRSFPGDSEQISAKKSKGSEKETEGPATENNQAIAKIIENIEKNQENINKTDDVRKKTAAQKKTNPTENVAKEKTGTKEVVIEKRSVASVKNNVQKDARKQVSAKGDGTKNVGASNEIADKNVNDGKKITNEKQTKQNNNVKSAGRVENNVISSVAIEKNTAKGKSVQNQAANNPTKNNAKKVVNGKVVKEVLNTNKGKVGEVVKKVVAKPSDVQKRVPSAENAKEVDSATKTVDASKRIMNSTFTTGKSSVATNFKKLVNISPIPKIVARVENKNPTMKKNSTNDKVTNKKVIPEPNKFKTGIVKPKHTAGSKNLPLNTLNKPSKIGNTKFASGKITKSVNNQKENKVVTKIPQKQLKTAVGVVVKKNPLRISPRKGISKPVNTKMNVGAKVGKPVTTNIPKLVKPKPRVA